MNKVIQCGRLTADPELRYTQAGKPVCSFSIAVDRPSKNAEKSADFHNCVAFNKTAEFISKYFNKGVRILIEGNLKNNNYTDKNGNKQYRTDIWIERAYFADGKSSSGSGAGNNNSFNNGFNNSNANGNLAPIPTGGDGFFPLGMDDDDDLPF